MYAVFLSLDFLAVRRFCSLRLSFLFDAFVEDVGDELKVTRMFKGIGTLVSKDDMQQSERVFDVVRDFAVFEGDDIVWRVFQVVVRVVGG